MYSVARLHCKRISETTQDFNMEEIICSAKHMSKIIKEMEHKINNF